jgi:SAM-dependent methyltransferase
MTVDRPPPALMLRQLLRGHWLSMCVCVIARLRIARHLAEGPQDVETLARAAGVVPEGLYRVLRALATVGVFQEVEPRRFALTDVGRCLPDIEGVAGAIIDLFWPAWGRLEAALRTGEEAFQLAHGLDFYHFLEANSDGARVFGEAMAQQVVETAQAVLAHYDFSRFTHIVDVGGGTGQLLTAILGATPAARGVVFDRPASAAAAAERIAALGLGARCEFRGGSFFDEVPSGGDAYLVSRVLQDWSDEQALVLLGHIRRAMAPHGKLLIIDVVPPSGTAPAPGKIYDVMMMVGPGGQTRTEDQFRSLVERAGFRLQRVLPTSALESVVEAEPLR